MKLLLIPGLLTAAFIFTGCETVVEQRHPARYGRVYHQPDYYDGRQDNRYDDRYYDNGRRQTYYNDGRSNRDVTVVNREVNVRNVSVPSNVEYSRRESTRSGNRQDRRVVVRKKKHKHADPRDDRR